VEHQKLQTDPANANDKHYASRSIMVGPWVQLVGPEHGLEIGGVKLLGFNAINGRKLLFTVILLAVLYVLSKLLRAIAQAVGHSKDERRQAYTLPHQERGPLSRTAFRLEEQQTMLHRDDDSRLEESKWI
jgi:hypothetical protein